VSSALSEVARIIQRESGIVLSPAQLPSLKAAIARVDDGLCAEDLLAASISSQTLQRLIDEITIRETFFFRHRSELDAIDWYSLLSSAHARGSKLVRVWIAGCASGEEAYTVAILASQAFSSKAPPVQILATDIASTALKQALAGQYGARATKMVPADLRERYFSNEGQVMSVCQQLRGLVEFRRHNLIGDPSPPIGQQRFDVILCRNVLIYFDRRTVDQVLLGLEGALAPGGLLLLGAVDRLSGASPFVVEKTSPGPVTRRSSRSLGAQRKGSPKPLAKIPAAVSSSSLTVKTSRQGSQPQRTETALADAVKAADRGELDLAVQAAKSALKEDPLDPQANFISGVAELARENPRAAVDPLRRALYIDPNFSLAAFNLARAHDALHEIQAAKRAYKQTLRTLDHSASDQTPAIDHSEQTDMTIACHARLRALR
jgi:chemotaxis protein methyltransferase CheR